MSRPDRPTNNRGRRGPDRHHHDHHRERAERLLWWLRPSPPARRSRNQRPRADVVADIVATAIALADREGVDALSMRRVAQELGIGTMSLYWYLESKDDLFDLAFDEILSAVILDPAELSDWRTGLTAIARRTRDVFLAHPWLVTVGARRPEVSPNVLRHVDQSLQLVDGLGLDRRAQETILWTVDDYIIGHILRQLSRAEVRQRTGAGDPRWADAMRGFIERFAGAEGLAHVTRLLAEDDHDDQERFFDGLDLVLAGVAARYGL